MKESINANSIKRALFSDTLGKMIDAKDIEKLDDIRTRFEDITTALYNSGYINCNSKIELSERVFDCYMEFRTRLF